MASPDTQTTPSPPTELEQRRRPLTKIARRGIGWLYLTAGMSAFNTLLYRLGIKAGLGFGLGVTQFVDGLSTGLARRVAAGGVSNSLIVACAIDALLIAALCFVAKSMQGGMRWPLLAALAFYALDTLFYLVSRDWASILIHGIGLWALWGSWSALGELRTLAQGTPITLAAPPVPTFELGGIPNFDEPDPSAPKPTGLFANVEGLPAVIGGLVVIGALAAFAFFMNRV